MMKGLSILIYNVKRLMYSSCFIFILLLCTFWFCLLLNDTIIETGIVEIDSYDSKFINTKIESARWCICKEISRARVLCVCACVNVCKNGSNNMR